MLGGIRENHLDVEHIYFLIDISLIFTRTLSKHKRNYVALPHLFFQETSFNAHWGRGNELCKRKEFKHPFSHFFSHTQDMVVTRRNSSPSVRHCPGEPTS